MDLNRLRIERGRPGGGRRGWLALGALGAGAALLVAWSQLGGGSAPAVELGRVRRAGGADVQGGAAANGYVVARRQAALSTDVQGRLVELRVQEGDRVRAGDLIARLDTEQLEASLQRARGEVAQAEAMARWFQVDHDRLANLVQSGDARPSDLDLARARLRDGDEVRRREPGR